MLGFVLSTPELVPKCKARTPAHLLLHMWFMKVAYKKRVAFDKLSNQMHLQV